MKEDIFEAWNGYEWEEFKTFKAACNMLEKRFKNYFLTGNEKEAYNMDLEQINRYTKEECYIYARVEIIKRNFTIRKY